MKHCEKCDCKTEEWVKLPELKIELSSVTIVKSEKDIIIPQCCRLPTYGEYALAIEKGIIPHTEDWFEFCTSPQWKGIRVVWLLIYTGGSYLDCSSLPFDDIGRSRGVRYVRELQ